MQSKNGLQKLWGNIGSQFYVKELDVMVYENYFPCVTMLNVGHSAPHITSEPGSRDGN